MTIGRLDVEAEACPFQFARDEVTTVRGEESKAEVVLERLRLNRGVGPHDLTGNCTSCDLVGMVGRVKDNDDAECEDVGD